MTFYPHSAIPSRPRQTWRHLSRRHPLARLKSEYEHADLPLPVRRQMRELFRCVSDPKRMTEEAVLLEVRRIQAQVELWRVRFEQSRISPIDKGYFTLTKAAALWNGILNKLNTVNEKKDRSRTQRKSVPITAPTRSRGTEDEPDESNGETA